MDEDGDRVTLGDGLEGKKHLKMPSAWNRVACVKFTHTSIRPGRLSAGSRRSMWLVVAKRRLERKELVVEGCTVMIINSLPALRCCNTIKAVEEATQTKSRSVVFSCCFLRLGCRCSGGSGVTGDTSCEGSIKILQKQYASCGHSAHESRQRVIGHAMGILDGDDLEYKIRTYPLDERLTTYMSKPNSPANE